jgi:hypothetical protein
MEWRDFMILNFNFNFGWKTEVRWRGLQMDLGSGGLAGMEVAGRILHSSSRVGSIEPKSDCKEIAFPVKAVARAGGRSLVFIHK